MLNFKRFNSLNQFGDTIVEVLIAMAVLGLTMTTSYKSINNILINFHEANERAQAVKLVETQIEELRAYIGAAPSSPTPDCFSYRSGVGTSNISPESSIGPAGTNPCIIQSDGTKAAATSEPAYKLSITAVVPPPYGTVPLPNTYTVTATWISQHGGNESASMEYRVL